jgi:hypothetical protein
MKVFFVMGLLRSFVAEHLKCAAPMQSGILRGAGIDRAGGGAIVAGAI